MNRLKCTLLLILLIGSSWSYSQTISRSVIGSAGSIDEQLSFTVGETVIATAESPSIILTQGFQQPDKIIGTFHDPVLGQVDVSLYPNPTTEALILEIEADQMLQLQVDFSDVRGRIILSSRDILVHGTARVQFCVQALANGTYLMMLRGKDGTVLKSFRFQKID